MNNFVSAPRSFAGYSFTKSIRIFVNRSIRSFVAALILMFAGNAYAVIEVGLAIENDLDINGNIVVINGGKVKVAYTVIEDTDNDLKKTDKIQLLRVSDDSIVSSVARGKKKSGSVSLKVKNSVGEQLYVRYIRKSGTVIATASDQVTSIAKESLADLTVGLNALRNGSIIVSSAAFVPEDNDVDYYRTANGNGILRLSSTGSGDRFLAPVLLPAGATITDIEMRVYDAVNPGRVQVDIFRVSGSTVTTTDADVGGPTTVTSGAINHSISSDVSQWIHLRAFISQADSLLGLYAVKINYTRSP